MVRDKALSLRRSHLRQKKRELCPVLCGRQRRALCCPTSIYVSKTSSSALRTSPPARLNSTTCGLHILALVAADNADVAGAHQGGKQSEAQIKARPQAGAIPFLFPRGTCSPCISPLSRRHLCGDAYSCLRTQRSHGREPVPPVCPHGLRRGLVSSSYCPVPLNVTLWRSSNLNRFSNFHNRTTPFLLP